LEGPGSHVVYEAPLSGDYAQHEALNLKCDCVGLWVPVWLHYASRKGKLHESAGE